MTQIRRKVKISSREEQLEARTPNGPNKSQNPVGWGLNEEDTVLQKVIMFIIHRQAGRQV